MNNYHLLTIANVLFVSMFVILALNNRLAHDDFYFLSHVNESGFWPALVKEYRSWSPNYVSVSLTYVIAQAAGQKFAYAGYTICLLFLCCHAFYLLIRNYKDQLLQKSKISHVNLAVFSSSVLFFASFTISETWFWLCATNSYFNSVIMALYACAFVFHRRVSIFTWLVIPITALYIGGSNGSFSLFLLVGQLALTGQYIWKHRSNTLQKFKKHHSPGAYILFFVVNLMAFLVLYAAPGNRIRESFFKDISVLESFILNFKTTGMIVLLRLPNIIPLLVLYTIPFYMLFAKKKTETPKVFWKRIFWATAILGLVLFTFQWPITYKVQDIGASRALFPLSLVMVVYCLYILYHLRQTFIFSEKTGRTVTRTAMFLIIVLSTKNLIIQTQTSRAYAAAYDKRMHIIKTQAHQDTIHLVPLPPSGFLYSAEISQNPAHFNNKHLKWGLGVEGKVLRE